jgi:hypothetical protein
VLQVPQENAPGRPWRHHNRRRDGLAKPLLSRRGTLRRAPTPRYTHDCARIFPFFGYARYQLGSCALRRLSAAVARLPLHCWRLWSRWLHWDQLCGSRRHPPHLLVELVLERREPLQPLQPLLNRSSGDAASRPLGIGWAHACAWARAWLPADAPARWSANSLFSRVIV